jgi:hypothetical protein
MDVVRALLNLAAMPQGQRPLRTVVAGPSGVLIDGLNATQGGCAGSLHASCWTGRPQRLTGTRSAQLRAPRECTTAERMARSFNP